MDNFYNLALEMSLKSSASTSHHGAVIVKGNTVVGMGYNNHAHHAETMAIEKCLYRLLRGSKGK